jgi:hypothetical protein
MTGGFKVFGKKNKMVAPFHAPVLLDLNKMRRLPARVTILGGFKIQPICARGRIDDPPSRELTRLVSRPSGRMTVLNSHLGEPDFSCPRSSGSSCMGRISAAIQTADARLCDLRFMARHRLLGAILRLPDWGSSVWFCISSLVVIGFITGCGWFTAGAQDATRAAGKRS